MQRFYIFDANGVISGNAKGYARHSIALRICTRFRHKLWGIYDNRQDLTDNTIYNIRII